MVSKENHRLIYCYFSLKALSKLFPKGICQNLSYKHSEKSFEEVFQNVSTKCFSKLDFGYLLLEALLLLLSKTLQAIHQFGSDTITIVKDSLITRDCRVSPGWLI